MTGEVQEIEQIAKHISIEKFLFILTAIFIFAKAFGQLAERFKQPAVLGELLAGVVLSASVLGVVPSVGVEGYKEFHVLAEIGVILLLFEIGLETRLGDLIKVGPVSAFVAVVGVIVPFVLGYFSVIYFQELSLITLETAMVGIVAIVVGATLTATSVGITARVLADIDKLQTKEAKIVLTAAVIDDVIGLIILGVVSGVVKSVGSDSAGGVDSITFSSVGIITVKAFGFLAVCILVGKVIAPRIFGFFSGFGDRTVCMVGIIFCLIYASFSNLFSLAPIIGAFAAGLVIRETAQHNVVEKGVKPVSSFFTPIFFVVVGSAVDISVFNPFIPENLPIQAVALILFVVAVVSKYVSGWAVYEKGVKKSTVGVGMIPRGEVGLIFAQLGLVCGVFKTDLFSAVTLMVILTTLIVPPLLGYLFREGEART